MSPDSTPASEPAYVFPPALVTAMRERLARRNSCLEGVSDDQLVTLLTTVFFAGLETYEGEHYPIRVAFLGKNTAELVMTEGAEAAALPLYRWKVMRFATPRPFATRELVKLAVTGIDGRIYSATSVLEDGTIATSGLAREGYNAGQDPFVKIVASRPGCLSIRSGDQLLLEYERGSIVSIDDDEGFIWGPVHVALRAIAERADVDQDVLTPYLQAVGFLVREIVAHGHGGILIISPEEQPAIAAPAPYRMVLDSSLAALLRLAWRSGKRKEAAFGQLLRGAFLTEAERVVEELVRLTAIDGAVLLNRELALMAFGVILPVGPEIPVVVTAPGGRERFVDFSTRGTRHRASATYAAAHPGSVVFVVSEDGQVSCLFRDGPDALVRLWRLAGETPHIA
jgi:hypothetical protein